MIMTILICKQRLLEEFLSPEENYFKAINNQLLMVYFELLALKQYSVMSDQMVRYRLFTQSYRPMFIVKNALLVYNRIEYR